ncbi:MAG: universal stress protein [Rubrivivax sp.]|nr:universal stress protein [Rubrivivax sp.]
MRIHIVLEGSPAGVVAGRLGMDLAARLGADVLLHMPVPDYPIEGGSLPLLETEQTAEEVAAATLGHRALARARRFLVAQGLAVHEVMTRDEDPLEAVLRLVRQRRSSIVVTGSQARGTLARLFGGSVEAALLKRCPVPVLVCREDTRALPAARGTVSRGSRARPRRARA